MINRIYRIMSTTNGVPQKVLLTQSRREVFSGCLPIRSKIAAAQTALKNGIMRGMRNRAKFVLAMTLAIAGGMAAPLAARSDGAVAGNWRRSN